MFINANKLTSALDNLRIIADADKKKPGILLDIQDDHVGIYYGNSTSASITQKINAVDDEGKCNFSIKDDEYRGPAIFDYTRFTDTLATCKESGNMKVHDVEFRLGRNADGSGKCVVVVSKYMEFEAPDESGANVQQVAELSSNEFNLNWCDKEHANNLQKALTVSMYDNMYDTTEAELWDRGELKEVLSGACTNSDGKAVYFLDSMGGLFTPGTAYHTFNKTPHEMKRPIYMTFPYAKSVMALIDKMNTNQVYIKCIDAPDGTTMAIIVFDENFTTSAYMRTVGKSQSHLTAIAQFADVDYDTVQFSTLTEVIKDCIKSVQSTNATQDAVINITVGESGLGTMTVSANDTGASVKNEYKVNGVFLSTSLERNGEAGQSLVKFSVNTKIFMDAINNNKYNHTAVDIKVNENKAVVRVGYFDDADLGKVYNELSEEKANAGLELTDADMMNARSEYLNTYNYFAATVVK